jgi:hypothetical protein
MGVSSESKRAVALRYFLTGRVVSFGGGRGHAGDGGGRRGLRHDGGRMRRVDGGKMEGESCGKRGGGRTRLYSWPRVGLPDEAAISNAAGGEGGHGAAKPDGVIYNLMQKD